MAKEISKELIRQIEIIALVLDKKGQYSEDDLSEIFNESLPTLRRDFSSIRNMSIDIHSSKKALNIEQEIKLKLLNKLINTYLALNETELIRNLKEIYKIHKDSTLNVFIQLVRAANEKNIINFEYEFDNDKQPIRRRITPIGITKTNRSFIVVGYENDEKDRIKFYLIEKIRNINFTEERSQHREFPSIHHLFDNSWGNYTSGDLENIILHFDKSCSYIKDRIFVNNQIIEDKDDYVEFKIQLKISNEFISWIMGWGNLVKVIKPLKLKNEIIKRSKDILKVYEK